MPVPAPPPVSMSPAAQQFMQSVSQIAGKLGIATIAIMIVDPGTRAARMISTADAVAQLRQLAAEKFDLVAAEDAVAETGWE